MFGALLSVVGESMRREFSKEENTVKMLYAIADKVKAAKERELSLLNHLCIPVGSRKRFGSWFDIRTSWF